MIVSIERLVSLPNNMKNREHGLKCLICGAESWPEYPGSNKSIDLPMACWAGHPTDKKTPAQPIDTHQELEDFEF